MLVSPREGFRLWAESYDTSANPLLALERRVLPDLIGVANRMRVVDVACGTGHWTAWFADRGASVLGVDLCEEMLARVPAGLRGRFTIGAAEDLPVANDSADLVICSFAAAYIPQLERAFAEMARVTKRGGRVIVSDVHPDAIAAGWTRSFRAAGRVYEVEHFRYSLDDFRDVARRVDLIPASEMHGHFGEPERSIFKNAGRPERFSEVVDVPAIWLGSWRKA